VWCPNQRVFSIQLLTFQVNADFGLSPLVTDILTLIPDSHLACVLAVGDSAFKAADYHVAVFNLGNKPFDPGAVGQPLVRCPILADAVLLEPKVEMMGTIMMFLYYESHG